MADYNAFETNLTGSLTTVFEDLDTDATAADKAAEIAAAFRAEIELVVTAEAGAVLPLTTKGDLVTHDGTQAIRIPVGADGTILTADSTAPSGYTFAALGAGGVAVPHDGLTGLSWAASGHTGSASGLAGWDAAGNPVVVPQGDYAPASHAVDTTNPHNVTPGQIGAATAAHNHDATYAPVVHDHDGAYQPIDANLTAIAGLVHADGSFVVSDGTAWTLESGDAARTSLGLGTGDAPSFAGLAVDTDGLYYDAANGRVGIGTASPSYVVHVQEPNGATSALRIDSTAGGRAAMIMASTASASYSACSLYAGTTNSGFRYADNRPFTILAQGKGDIENNANGGANAFQLSALLTGSRVDATFYGHVLMRNTYGVRPSSTADGAYFALSGRDSGSGSYVDFLTVTNGNPATCDLAPSVTIGGVAISDANHNHDTSYAPLSHATDTANPHGVTPSQIGAVPVAYASITNTSNPTASAASVNPFAAASHAAHTYDANVSPVGITYDSATGLFAVTDAGAYEIAPTLNLIASANTTATLVIQVNGATVYTLAAQQVTTNAFARTFPVMRDLAAGDTIAVLYASDTAALLRGDAGTTLNIRRVG